jgi:hypothetical protein
VVIEGTASKQSWPSIGVASPRRFLCFVMPLTLTCVPYPFVSLHQVYKDDRPPVVVEIEDETDADMIAVLHDWSIPVGINMVNIGVSGRAAISPYLLLPSSTMSFLHCLTSSSIRIYHSSCPALECSQRVRAVRCPYCCARR